MAELRLGSLFDGIGVFPLAAVTLRHPCRYGPVRSRKPRSPSPGATSRTWRIWATSQSWTAGRSRPSTCITFRLTLSKSLTDRQPHGPCGGKIQPVLSCHPHHSRNEGGDQWIYFQLSLFGKTSWERFLQMTGWILEPSYPRSQTPKFQCLLLEDGQDAGMVRGGCARSRMAAHGRPALGKAPAGTTAANLSCGRLWRAACSTKYCLSPAQCSHFLRLAEMRGLSASGGDRGPFIEAGRRVPSHPTLSRLPYAGSRQKSGQANAFRNSFGLPTDPFPTLLASDCQPLCLLV